MAFSVWDVPERAIGVGAVYAAIRAHGSMDVGLPPGANFFLFSDFAQGIKALRGAGFDSPTVRQAPQVWRIDDPDSLFDKIVGSSVACRDDASRAEPLCEAGHKRCATRESNRVQTWYLFRASNALVNDNLAASYCGRFTMY
jgi:hypothetical protein